MRTSTDAGRSRRRFLAATGALATVGSVGLSGCTSNSGSGSDGETTTYEGTVVEVGPGGHYTFEPGTDEPLHVSSGTTVTFVWKSNNHNIVVGSQPDDADWQGTPGDASKTYNEGYTYEHTFDVAGSYHYWCQPHKSLGMVADIVVR